MKTVIGIVLVVMLAGCTHTNYEDSQGNKFSRTRVLQKESLKNVAVTKDANGMTVNIGSVEGEVSSEAHQIIEAIKAGVLIGRMAGGGD